MMTQAEQMFMSNICDDSRNVVCRQYNGLRRSRILTFRSVYFTLLDGTTSKQEVIKAVDRHAV